MIILNIIGNVQMNPVLIIMCYHINKKDYENKFLETLTEKFKKMIIYNTKMVRKLNNIWTSLWIMILKVIIDKEIEPCFTVNENGCWKTNELDFPNAICQQTLISKPLSAKSNQQILFSKSCIITIISRSSSSKCHQYYQ